MNFQIYRVLHMHMQLVDHDTIFRWFVVTHDGEDAAMKHEDEDATDTREYPCLLRVTDGKSTKFSTLVRVDECRNSTPTMATSQNCDDNDPTQTRKKREKVRAEEAAKRKQKMTSRSCSLVEREGKEGGKDSARSKPLMLCYVFLLLKIIILTKISGQYPMVEEMPENVG
ncbi:hypothetical protein CPB84DRAFT_1746735 [Gymnopilus junonius]|uniref:Uncharacterized protein n=1 Tax=Gymnopilus junonius TaxID=109634 RepID=A0A9P5NQP5_GYMJU|nr:hypothetical protein CPB84DRAFT_1746735 [Gymnopilus junonius]